MEQEEKGMSPKVGVGTPGLQSLAPALTSEKGSFSLQSSLAAKDFLALGAECFWQKAWALLKLSPLTPGHLSLPRQRSTSQ